MLPSSAQGFTLLEMIIVLVISVLGFAVVGSNIRSGNETTRLQGVARDLASALRFAQSQSLMTRQPTSVTVDLRDNSYIINSNSRRKVFRFDEQIEVSLTVAEEEFKEDEYGSIKFFGDGSSTGGRVTLTWGPQLKRIDVNWITGQVTIADAAS